MSSCRATNANAPPAGSECECHRKGEPANSPEIPDGSDLDKTYRDSDGRECSLDVMCMREPGWAASVIRTLQQRVWSEQSLVRKLDADYSAARVGIMALVGELHEHLALMVRYLEEETSQGDGIQERHWDGYQGAKSVLARTAPNQPSWENAQLEIHDLLERASRVPGLTAELDNARHVLAQVQRVVDFGPRYVGAEADAVEAVLDEVRAALRGEPHLV